MYFLQIETSLTCLARTSLHLAIQYGKSTKKSIFIQQFSFWRLSGKVAVSTPLEPVLPKIGQF